MSLLLSLRIHVLFGFFERQVERVQERYWWLMLMTHKGGEKAGLIRENLRPHCRPNTCVKGKGRGSKMGKESLGAWFGIDKILANSTGCSKANTVHWEASIGQQWSGNRKAYMLWLQNTTEELGSAWLSHWLDFYCEFISIYNLFILVDLSIELASYYLSSIYLYQYGHLLYFKG